MTRKGKYIKFRRHFLLCFKTMGYLQTCMMCTSLSDSIKNRSFIYCFKKSLSMFRLLQQFEHFLAVRICKLIACIVVSLTFLAFKGV